MSMTSGSATFMAQANRNGSTPRENFHNFFDCWLVEQNQHLQQLKSISKEQSETEEYLRPLLERVIHHYEDYYRAKSSCAKDDIYSMFDPSWLSSLEDAFLWIGGWRPSMAFHLLYSKSGIQLEAKLEEILQGIRTRDLGDISSTQLGQVNELQRETLREEKDITEKLAKQQNKVANPSMVELSHVATEMILKGEAIDEGRVDAALKTKEDGLVEMLERADELRLNTLKNVLSILTPIQGVHFLIAAAELHLRLHDWGKTKDAS